MINLRDYIEEIEPSNGHKKRFLIKLDSKFHQNNKLQRLIPIIAGVAVLSGLLLVAYFQFYTIDYVPTNKLILANTTEEFVEAEYYYQGEIEKKLMKIDSLAVGTMVSDDLYSELQEIDKTMESLKCDLIKNPGDQRIIDAVLNIYILKIETIDIFIKKAKHQKKYENLI